jgi:threonine aldolase
MAMRMKQIFIHKGFEFFVDSPTNQQFVIMDNQLVDKLEQKMRFTHFGQADKNHTICRFVTSWATTEEELDELEKILR